MSDDSSRCICGGPLLLSFNLLVLACALALWSMMKEAKRADTEIHEQMQKAEQEAQRLSTARAHFTSLYSELSVLSHDNAAAAAIVQKYGIQIQNDQTSGAAKK